MDEKCRHFRALTEKIAAASRANNNQKTNKESSQPHLLDSIAKLILFDQIARNIFRYQSEAFAYGDLVLQVLQGMILSDSPQATAITDEALAKFVGGDVTLCDCFFVSVACQHQEKPMFHGVDSKLLRLMGERWPESKDFLKIAQSHSDSHFEVLQRFGRYPHRNHVYGRENTPEEREWLDDYDNLPIWVKSQLPKTS